MAKVLGLDLGTNSIGWAVTEHRENAIIGIGSRIIPMTQDTLGAFEGGGNIETQTSARTAARGVRRLAERNKLRRERLLRVLNVVGMLPEHFSCTINFDRAKGAIGKINEDTQDKIAWEKLADGTYSFIFKSSFEEMLAEFSQLSPNFDSTQKVPCDWTLYYLRKKALTKALSNEELAWVLLSFNQKRGYYQLRGEEDQGETQGKCVEYHKLLVANVEQSDTSKGKEVWYDITLANGWVYKRSSKIPLFDWIGKEKEFVVTSQIDSNGNVKLDKDGAEKRSFRAPSEDDWTLIKKRTEQEVRLSGKTVGEYIYDAIVANPKQKVRGSLVRTIERHFYKDELTQILATQCALNPALKSRELYGKAIEELYQSNIAYRNSIAKRDFAYLLRDDIIFYQRPLKSKKSLIADCPYESHSYISKENNVATQGIKCTSRSNPLFQEIRLWQFLRSLRLLSADDGRDVTAELLPTTDSKIELFEWLNNRDSITQDILFGSFFKLKKSKESKRYPCRWNYVEDKEYPCNSTRYTLLSNLEKCGVPAGVLSQCAISKSGKQLGHNVEYALWHLLYSVLDKQELVSALNSFAERYNLPTTFIEQFKKIKPFENSYAAYSEKSIKKLLPLMRMGKYWNHDNIDSSTLERIEKIINGEYDDNIKSRIYSDAINLLKVEDFSNLPLWLVCYIVYNRHSEASDAARWSTPSDIKSYIDNFKQHSLNNPIVEQVTLETLRVVHDIWVKYGKIDKINIELGREIKQPKKAREADMKRNTENENTNLRIKAMLQEFQLDSTIENVRPYSPSQQSLLKIYEDGALRSQKVLPDDIDKISRSSSPSPSEIVRYKLWLEQKYRSPYTGEVIPLGRLFTADYEIEHVIPRKLYFDDSFNNKIICESSVNGLKGARLAMTFIEEERGRVLEHCGRQVKVFSVDEYTEFVKSYYVTNKPKCERLLMSEIPDKFISRQLNDTRYISKLVMSLMSNVVRGEDEDDIATSANVVPCNGAITTRLKRDWGLNDIWNKIIAPRFERLNEKSGTNDYGHWECRDGKNVFLTRVPLYKQKGFNKKRIDHRHHAMDALVISCATRNHVAYLNNEAAKDSKADTRYDLQHKLCDKVKQDDRGSYQWRFKKPWDSFTQDAERALREVVVSFKQNLRVLTRTNNRTQALDSNGRRIYKVQEGENLAIRKSLHKDTVYGRVNLRLKRCVGLKDAVANFKDIVDVELKARVKSMLDEGADEKSIVKLLKSELGSVKIEVFYFTDDTKEPIVATRKSLDDSFDAKKIGAITDTGIQKILLAWLERSDNDPKLAFSPEGVVEMNNSIVELNGGKQHQPIMKVRVTEIMGSKFSVGERGCKSAKYVEADKGTNLFFGIYDRGEGVRRGFESVPLNVVIERLKQKLPAVALENESGDRLLFSLSPNDLVYLPTEEQIGRPLSVEDIDKERIYKMVSSTGKECYFIKANVAVSIIDKFEFSPLNKSERSITGEMIKDICFKIKVDRLGNIVKIEG